MPYNIRKAGDKFCVYKANSDERMGCHDTRAEAGAQMRALYANEADDSSIEFNLGSVDAVANHLKAALESTLSEEARNHVAAALELLGEIKAEKPESHPEIMIPGLLADGSKSALEEFSWEGPIVFEGVKTGDNRVFKLGSITWDETTLPWAFRWQKESTKGHEGAVAIGRVDRLERKPDGTIYAYGVVIPELNEEAAEYMRLLESGVASGVSVDGDSAEFEVHEAVEGVQPTVEFSAMRLRSLTAVDIPAFNKAQIDITEEVEEGSVGDLEEFGGKPSKGTEKDQRLASNKQRKKRVSWAYNLTAAGIPVKPKTEWFVDPKFDGPTPITVTEGGFVYGHLALFDTCHIGLPGCVTPPQGNSYKYFHTGEVYTESGDTVDVGHLTFNTGHAGMADSAKAAAAHYDHTGMVAADVRAGEDKYGVWVVGALRSNLSDEDIRSFRAAPLSGDWRRIAGKLELVGALAVNVPGFPVPRARALVASGETETLITFDSDVDEEMAKKRNSLHNKVRKIEIGGRIDHSFATKTEDGESFPASDYAYVPDPDMPSTWKLRLTSTPGGDPDPQIVGAAIAALGKGFRGNKVQIPADALGKVKAKVRAAWKKANPDKDEDQMPEVIKD